MLWIIGPGRFYGSVSILTLSLNQSLRESGKRSLTMTLVSRLQSILRKPMKITDADYEDHIAKLESGFKATFGEDLAPYLVTQMCFDLLAAKKIEYVKSYLRTWSGMELFNLADRMLKKETSLPPGLRGMVGGVNKVPSVGIDLTLPLKRDSLSEEILPKGLPVSNGKKKLASIEQARAKKSASDSELGPRSPKAS